MDGRVKIKKVRNVFKPRWWQFRFRYRLWRSRRRSEKFRAQLSPQERQLLDKAHETAERKILYGDSDA
jgi:hypothetical protein